MRLHAVPKMDFSRRGPIPRFRLCALLVGILLFPACGKALYPLDCDQRMGSGDYDLVLQGCDDPYYQASAYLGKAGFNLLEMVSAPNTSDLVGLLGLTPENIDERRGFLNAAIETVREPANSGEAFALLLSAFLGMGVTATQYLDNGAGGGVALDNSIDQGEVDDFTGMTENPGANQTFLPAAAPYFQVIADGTPYTMICGDLILNFILCDNDNLDLMKIYDDADGSGILDTGAPPSVESLAESVVRAALPGVGIEVNLMVQMVNLELPFSFDAEKLANMKAFLGQGDPAGEITIGVVGYLDLMKAANDAMAEFSGDSEGLPEINTAIDDLRTSLDNGAACDAANDPVLSPIQNALYEVYASAPGTALTPAPADGNFAPYSIVPDALAALSNVGEAFPDFGEGVTFVWKDVATLGIKWLYPLEARPGGGFDIANATPRVDLADPTFQEHFGYIPLLTPAAATAMDGEVSFMELLCVGGP